MNNVGKPAAGKVSQGACENGRTPGVEYIRILSHFANAEAEMSRLRLAEMSRAARGFQREQDDGEVL
jgi:hypothetical protein